MNRQFRATEDREKRTGEKPTQRAGLALSLFLHRAGVLARPIR
jgi:hypothetical protein